MFGHEIKSCSDDKVIQMLKEKVTEGIFGTWLCAENNEFQLGINLEELHTEV